MADDLNRSSNGGVGRGYDGQGYGPHVEEFIEQLPSRQPETFSEMASKSLRGRQPSTIYRDSNAFSRSGRELEEEIVKSLEQDMLADDSAADNLDAAIRTIPTTLTLKRNIKHRLSSKKAKKITRCKYLMYECGMGWQHFKYNFKKAVGLFDLWRSHLVVIDGHFGSSVASYFIFLKWVLLINLPLFLLTFAFLVVPQILYRVTQREPRNYADAETFKGIELLTGQGFFENTEMYYGFYTNETLEAIPGMTYQMKYAYLFTCGGYYLFCLILLAYSYLHSYQKYYIESSVSLSQYYFSMVLCGWDYGITVPDTAKLKNMSIFNELKERLSGRVNVSKQDRTMSRKVVLAIRRMLLWLIVLALLGGAGYATYVISMELSLTTAKADETSIPVVSSLAMPVVISSMHLIIPMLFTLIERYEEYSEPRYELYVHMFRDMALKATILAVLVFFWFDTAAAELECWETFVGQEIYRLVIVDLVFTLGYSFVMEFMRRLVCSTNRAEFAVGRHTLELIYSQSLCWLGVYYCPVIPIIVIVKLAITFYVKRYSVVSNCQSSLKPWRASRTHTIFVGYLFGFFLLCLIHFGCMVSLMEPSTQCGPYTNMGSAFGVVNSLVGQWQDNSQVLDDLFDFITSPGLIAGLLVLFSVVMYYMRIIMLSHHSMVQQLRLQITSERKDKKFLMNLLNQVRLRGGPVNTPKGPTMYKATTSNTSVSGTHGRMFARTVAEGMMTSPHSGQ